MYALYRPAAHLQHVIACYWVVDTVLPAGQPLQETIFVDGRADVIFNYGDAYERVTAGTPTSRQVAKTSIDGQRNYPVKIHQVGHVKLVGVRFKVGGLAAVSGLPALELSNQQVDVNTLWEDDAEVLEARLFDAFGNPNAQRQLLNDFFTARLQPQRPDWLKALSANVAHTNLDAVASDLGLSRRTLNRRMNAQVGFSAKFYARVLRFHTALSLLRTPMPLAEVALEAGFYDQAHLNHDVLQLSGQSPGTFRDLLHKRIQARDAARAAPNPVPPNPVAPNLVPFLQDGSPAQ
ncbi:MAG: helix-turn-helix domain-containing protein [Deinococcota bacterium]